MFTATTRPVTDLAAGTDRQVLETPAVSVRGLRRSYGRFEAVRGIDLEIGRGEIFALLGPNGAGKTTTLEILEGCRQRSGGEVEVLGVDPARGDRAWRERIGIVLQDSLPEPELTVRECLALYAGYYSSSRELDDTLARVGLAELAVRRCEQLSGGQRRRLDVALALIGGPELLFLDEPTTGFDPAARREMWDLVKSLRSGGTTIVLTTHLKRRRATPAPAGVVIAGRAITSLVVSLAVTTAVIMLGAVVYGVHVALGALGALALSIAVGSLALACLGYAVTTVIGPADAAQPATLAVTLPLGFISGVYIPPPNLPGALHHVAQAFPLEYLVAALSHGFLPGGTGVAWGDLAILAAWGLGGFALALGRFRWTPAASTA